MCIWNNVWRGELSAPNMVQSTICTVHSRHLSSILTPNTLMALHPTFVTQAYLQGGTIMPNAQLSNFLETLPLPESSRSHLSIHGISNLLNPINYVTKRQNKNWQRQQKSQCSCSSRSCIVSPRSPMTMNQDSKDLASKISRLLSRPHRIREWLMAT